MKEKVSLLHVLAALISLLVAAPALASAGMEVPEPSDMMLFALGLTGLVIGRYYAGRREG